MAAKKLKKTLKIRGKKHTVKSCSNSMAAAKKLQREIQARGYTSTCVKRAGKVCTTQGPKSKNRSKKRSKKR